MKSHGSQSPLTLHLPELQYPLLVFPFQLQILWVSLGFPCCSLSTTAYSCRSNSTGPPNATGAQMPNARVNHLYPVASCPAASKTHAFSTCLPQCPLFRWLAAWLLLPTGWGPFLDHLRTISLSFCHSRLAELTSTWASIIATTTCSQFTATHKKLQLPSARLCIICVLCLTVLCNNCQHQTSLSSSTDCWDFPGSNLQWGLSCWCGKTDYIWLLHLGSMP